MAKYELELCPNDFKNIVDKFNKLEKNLPKLQSIILDKLSEYTRERMKYYIDKSVNTDYATGHLSNSVAIQKINESTVKVYVDEGLCPYAVYVEYGTGIIGAGTHPDYNGAYKQEGWWYPTNENDPNPNKKQLPNGDWVVYTEGQVAHKFLYNAYQDLKQKYKWIVLKTLKEEGYI